MYLYLPNHSQLNRFRAKIYRSMVASSSSWLFIKRRKNYMLNVIITAHKFIKKKVVVYKEKMHKELQLMQLILI